MGPLNLADADLKGFDAVDAGRYNAEIFALTMDAVKNADGSGKMPAGTPMIKVQVKLFSDSEGNSDGIQNRRVFQTFVIPPKDYDQKKASNMKGMIARFFIALGEPEEKVVNPKFDPDFEEYVGRPVVVTLKKEAKKDRAGNVIADEYVNQITGFKPAGSIGATAGVGSIL